MSHSLLIFFLLMRTREHENKVIERLYRFYIGHEFAYNHSWERKKMDEVWKLSIEEELAWAYTTIEYHQIECYTSVSVAAQRIRRIFEGELRTGLCYLSLTYEKRIVLFIENEKLMRACIKNDIDTVKWLFDNVDRNIIDFKRGINRSALHEAALHHNGRSLVRLLCQYGADPKQRDSLG